MAGTPSRHLIDSFDEPRGNRLHRAVDILAPRYTPVQAVDGGRIAGLLVSAAGGLSIYHVDPGSRYCYLYAHLSSYAPGLSEGRAVKRSEVIGYVGTTGNAPEHAPHLHFAVFQLRENGNCWNGTAINPLLVLE